jgi:hypothetical protein
LEIAEGNPGHLSRFDRRVHTYENIMNIRCSRHFPSLSERRWVMRGEGEERWVELCEQAVVEQDPRKVLALVTEINRLLEEAVNEEDGRPVFAGPSLELNVALWHQLAACRDTRRVVRRSGSGITCDALLLSPSLLLLPAASVLFCCKAQAGTAASFQLLIEIGDL